MFDNVCTLPLSSELFAQAIHSAEPIVSVGLSAGHVQIFRLPAVEEADDADSEADLGFGEVVTQWTTRRHKGSCRSLAFSIDGEGECNLTLLAETPKLLEQLIDLRYQQILRCHWRLPENS